MLLFENAQDLTIFRDTQNAVVTRNGIDGCYLYDVLLPAIQQGDWDILSRMIVYQDESIVIRFNDDRWRFLESNIKAKSIVNINFYIDDRAADNVVRIKENKRNIINQIKCVALVMMYFSRQKITLKSICCYINELRGIFAKKMIESGFVGFEDLTIDTIEELKRDGLNLATSVAFRGLNKVRGISGYLPFDINYPKLGHSLFHVVKVESEQKTVIPLRIYCELINKFSELITEAYKYRDDIENEVKRSIEDYRCNIDTRLTNLRCGKGKLYKQEVQSSKSIERFLIELEKNGVPFVDNNKNSKWDSIYKRIKPNFYSSALSSHYYTFLGNKYQWGEVEPYLIKLTGMAGWLCMAFSGMRIDELYSMHPDFGAQTIDNIKVLTTVQSKITGSSQTKDDVFVTNDIGHKAFAVLDSIHRPYRKYFDESENTRLFAILVSRRYPKSLSKTSLGICISKVVNQNPGIDLTLSSSDFDYLNASEKKHNYSIGDIYHFSPHQCRRSLAYYLIGYELCSFPALKQQLGHFSMAMTRWYARNATSYRKFWKEIQNEKMLQQAEVYARIFKRMANGERVAGGKGKQYLEVIAKSGKSYFEQGINKQFLSAEYWKEMLMNKKEHLHAIAPGMYCTNSSCSMRIKIDLTECVSCEFDYIENVAYAESSRMDAMRDLGFMIEMNDLNSSSATRCYMQIKAAERIMTDLDFDFEPYLFTKEVESMIIVTGEVI
ncbi:TPA: integrase [Photobacterium damselae]